MSLPDAAATVDVLVLDVDGVLTDGTLYYGPEGELLKAFHVRDGLGIKLLRSEGVEVCVITAKVGAPLQRRLEALGIEHAFTGREDKLTALLGLESELGIDPARIAYVGDDLPDLPPMRRVGLPIAVADAHHRALEAAAWTTDRAGGRGAVREVADALLEARGRADAAVNAYLAEHGGRP